MRQKRRSYRGPEDDDGDAIGEDLAAVNERLDALTRQLERIAQPGAAPRAPASIPDDRADRVSDALARLDRRLDQVISEGRTAAGSFQPRARYASPLPAPQQYAPAPPQPAPPAAPGRDPAHWAAQISARQRALDGLPAATAPAAAPQAQWAAPDLAGLEHQLHQINAQISSLHQPYEDALSALRSDLAEIGRAMTEALPRRAIEALEAEVHALAERVDRTRQAGADGAALGSLERELAEVRNALRSLTPAESLAGFEEAVRGLYHKIDQIVASGHAPQGDPAAFKQLEQAVVSLRGVVSNVASDGALAQLSAEVRGLAAQFERATADSSSEALAKLEARIASLMESGRAVPPELEGSIRQLSERLDRMQLSQGDQLALGALEDRIAKLSEKLDASDSRLGHLEAIERGLADLLVYLEEMRSGGFRAPPAAPEAPAAAPVPAVVQSPLDLISDLPAHQAPTIQPVAPEPVPMLPPAPVTPPATTEAFAPPPPTPMPPPQARPPSEPRPQPVRQMPHGPQRQPIDPNLPPDTPLEPGSGAPRIKPGSAAARIAASEAALGNVRPALAETGGKSAAIAAARNAAKAAYLDTPVKVPKSLGRKPGKWLKWPFKKKAMEPLPPQPQFQAPVAAPVLPPMTASMPASMPAPALTPKMPAAAPLTMPSEMPSTSSMPAPMALDDGPIEAPLSRGRKILRILKSILIAASVVIIVVGAAQTAIELLFPDTATQTPAATPTEQSGSPAKTEPKTRAPSSTPSRPMPAPEGTLPAPSTADPDQTNSINSNSSFFDPTTAIKLPDVTGSIPRKTAAPRPQATTPTGQSNIETLPTSISPALRTAAAANDPAAEYEIGSRYAEGRGVPQNVADAVLWLQRAADAGFAPAQFRLASLNEKGDGGLKKDLQTARRLYLAAAGKGHAKAMHNLAVLYAEGIDGKPDYKAASEWFRKAASYGVTDSQYNLAILFARGIGVQVNLAESYRWFTLAASSGDSDAARKRDEVAARLDAKTLAMAKSAVQAFVAEREPDEATNLKAPPGGWDHVPAAPAKPKRQASGAASQVPASRAPASIVR